MTEYTYFKVTDCEDFGYYRVSGDRESARVEMTDYTGFWATSAWDGADTTTRDFLRGRREISADDMPKELL